MSALNIVHLYRLRLRSRWVQECFAVVGLAAGVALLFASQVSSSSLQSSVAGLSRGIAGKARLQLVARGAQGFDQRLLERVRAIHGVRVAAPVLEAGAQAAGPSGSRSIELIGADQSLSALGGELVRGTALRPFGNIGAVVLPAPLATAIGVSGFGREVSFQVAGHSSEAPLYSRLRERQIGALAWSAVAIVPLRFAQEMTGLQGRVSRILVEPAPGREARVRAALGAVTAGHLDVEGIDHEETLFAAAAKANSQSSALFSAISALVGFLFAFNAMLLTVPQRRALAVDMRRDGHTARSVIGVLLLDGFVLGAVSCALGLTLGQELSIHVLHSNPAFLSLAFAVGSERMVSWQDVAIACGGGMLAAIVAVLSPVHDVLARDPLVATGAKKNGATAYLSGPPPARAALAGLACLGGASAILLADPDAAIPGMVLLVAALLLELPFALQLTLTLVNRLARMLTGAIPHVATMELSAGGARVLAITATGAVAIFGSVAIQGAHGDLLAGLEAATREMNVAADVWVSPAGSYDLLDTSPFAPVQEAKLARLADVRAVRPYRSGLLDIGKRRALVIAPPSQANPLLPAGQLLRSDPRQAEERVRGGGWVVLSEAIASEQHLRVGQAFTLPSPDPRVFRVAALSTNVGWAPGSIFMNAEDYAQAWGSKQIAAYNILLGKVVSAEQGVNEIRRALGAHSGLSIQSAAEHASAQVALSRQALARLGQIAALIPIVAVLAMAAAIAAMIWQRRPRLAKLKLEGFDRVQLWHTILLEGLLMLGVGCLTGALFGLYGQQLADRALAKTINFPVLYSVTVLPALESLAVVIATALAIIAVPGYLAASVPAALALQD